MEQTVYLIDTNVVIDYLGEKLPAAGMDFMKLVTYAAPVISIVTKIELLCFNASEEHHRQLIAFLNNATILGLTDGVADMCVDIRKQYKTSLPDAIIAATALMYYRVLVSRNVPDFQNIRGLRIINPHRLQPTERVVGNNKHTIQ